MIGIRKLYGGKALYFVARGGIVEPPGCRFAQFDWYAPAEGEAIRCARLDLKTGKWSTSRTPSRDTKVFDRSIVVPAFCNAHTHLDLCHHARPIGEQGISFPDWLGEMILRGRAGSYDPEASIAKGMQQSADFGVGWIGDISGMPWSAHEGDSEIATRMTYLEILGLDKSFNPQRIGLLEQAIQKIPTGVPSGISPHAPYSINSGLFKTVITKAIDSCLPVAMHLCESREERDLHDSGKGALIDVLKRAGVWRNEVDLPSSAESLTELGRCSRSLIIHFNYPTEEEIGIVTKHRDSMSITWCPRTHAWFGHEKWPLDEFRKRGLRICIGTDSLASNPDLDVLAELQFIHSHYPEIPPQEILRWGTVNGREALTGLPALQGKGLPERLAILQFDSIDGKNPFETLLGSRPASRLLLVS